MVRMPPGFMATQRPEAGDTVGHSAAAVIVSEIGDRAPEMGGGKFSKAHPTSSRSLA